MAGPHISFTWPGLVLMLALLFLSLTTTPTHGLPISSEISTSPSHLLTARFTLPPTIVNPKPPKPGRPGRDPPELPENPNNPENEPHKPNPGGEGGNGSGDRPDPKSGEERGMFKDRRGQCCSKKNRKETDLCP
ncbi:hypothetical protein EPUS_08838 [Endocarpon pusillum Z07020]|uniref:Uncharacterized protein n=1 Tax=Endocarpon pusillum (strain Z07020 / HMAS-L-300199) TaxID=1263415 RepID=U1HZM8_ENDPU|nr:uncharacterized protein EPUS_08838 [Endocarpon pusillum Z07020]ERF75024.1 hypothetical protein EPUS_08838 [Endocarpon pusillum Z07020]